MRHFIQIILLFLLILLLAGCSSGGNSARKADNSNAVENALNEQIAAADPAQSDTEADANDTAEVEPETTAQSDVPDTASTEDSTDTANTENVDYDLTVMNSDMVYATVYQMMVNPDSYVGKTVKMTGPFYPYTNADGTVYYPACVIEDATACCAQGMEFVLNGAEYPDGYPEMGTTIIVTGTFETYQEDGNLYCHLADASLETPEE